MIVYSGKQYWNDFNNWDEALFQDANRPRDNDKFKIRPWLQSDKWKQREVNKDITTVASSLIAQQSISAPAWTAYYFPPSLNQIEKTWNPWCVISEEWKIEIVEDGTYIIQASWQFRFGSTPSNWHLYMENVAILKRIDGTYTIQAKTQGRVCANTNEHYDQLSVLYTWWFTKWTVFTVWACHSYNSVDPITITEIINIHRLA